MGISNCCAVVGYGSDINPVFNLIKQARVDEGRDQLMTGSELEHPIPKALADALRLFNGTLEVVLTRLGDMNVLPFLHVTLAFMHHLSFYPEAMSYLAPGYPWSKTAEMLNTLIGTPSHHGRIERQEFPGTEKGDAARPLPEDYAMRGLVWADKYFPAEWFSDDKIDDDEKYFEVASMTETRRERVLYLGCRIAARGGGWLQYDPTTHRFGGSSPHSFKDEPLTPAPNKLTDYDELPDAVANTQV